MKEIKRTGEANPDHRYTLFLGAGCSKSSGIPTAGELVRDHWMPEMAPSGEAPIKWAENHIDGFDRNEPAASYEAVIEQRFPKPRMRQTEIERICEVASPGFGYSVVAQLCAQNNTPFSVVLTTNFDDLVADAMVLYAESRPLIIHHAALAEYIRPTRSRPMVVKIHGDARLLPKNTALETAEIEQALREQVKKLLDDRGLLFFGYAGADDSVFQMLAELPSNALGLGVYWINENPPASEKFRNWLEERQATWVRHTDFDEAMLHFYCAYKLAPPTKDRFDRIFDTWERQFDELKRQIDAKPDEDQDKARLVAEAEAVRSSIDAWRSVNRILAMDKQDSDAILSAYQTAVREHPGFAPLLSNCAVFLTEVRRDYDAAQIFYKRAIEADPRHASSLGNYALFLTDIRGDHDAAETFYKRAINADPKDADILGNYANFLKNIHGDYDAAETFYKRAINADPRHASILNNYAFFLTDVRGDHDAAETFFKRAIDADLKDASILVNYAVFLADVRGNHDTAEIMFKCAIDADPKHAYSLGSYAFFLTDIRSDHDTAETFYKRAINTDPKDADILNNYATFLTDVRSDYDAAETFFKRAIDADPRHARNLGNYAIFLKNVRGDYDAAETFYKRAIDANPKDTDILGNYANLLINVRGDHDTAETFYKRAIDTDSKDANIFGNYANLLTNVHGDHDTAETFYKRAIDADPRHANNLSNYAVFLTEVRGDYDAAETFYKRAIDVNYKGANILGNYANFLTNVRGDHDTAETFYKRAIDANPRHARNLSNYALFLKNVRGDHDAAETFYKRAIDADPKDAYILGNYGEFLLYRSERERGFDFLDRSDKVAKDKGGLNRMVANDICRAIYSAGADRRAALSRLHRSLRAIKALCPSWSQAERKRHLSAAAVADRKWLAKLIDVSEGKARINELDDWPEWQEARGKKRR